MSSSGKQPLTPQQKERILFLHQQGHAIGAIAQELGIADPRKISGFIRSAINLGKIPAPPPQGIPSIPEVSLMPTPPPFPSVPPEPAAGYAPAPPPPPYTAPVLPPAPQAAYAPPPLQGAHPPHNPQASGAGYQPPAPDGFSGWRPASSYAGGFSYASQVTRFQVERKEPLAESGVMGQHAAPFSDHELGNAYGEGVYRVLRFDPGKTIPHETEVKIGPAYGAPRWPKRAAAADARGHERPAGYYRPSWRSGGSPGYERPYEQGESGEERPAYRPSYERPQALYDYPYARHSGGAETQMAAEAIREMGKAHDRTINQLEKSREAGPDTFLTRFFSEQQNLWQQRQADDERRRAEERKDDQDKWQRRIDEREAEAKSRADEREAENKRRADDDQKRHDRELDRIQKESEVRDRDRKADADARDKDREKEFTRILDLEDRRLNILKEEAKHRQDSLEAELKRNREETKALLDKNEKELKETKDATAEQIGESEEKIEKEMTRRQESLDREYRLRETGQKKEHELQEKLLQAKQEAMSTQAGNEIFSTINTIIKEFSKGLEKIVDLKKIEASTQLSPEAQAAAISRGAIDGNVMGEPRRSEPEAQPQKPQAQAQAAQAPGKNGNGAPAAPEAQPQKQGEAPMEEVIQEQLQRPFFKQVLKEWSLHVKTHQDPTTFANMYLEWMRDPLDHEGRKACSMFANFMKPREWPDMMKILKPKLEKDVVAVFETQEAEEFYDGFRAMVVEQIRDYWEQFLAQRKAQRAAAAAAGKEVQDVPEGQGLVEEPKKSA